MLQVDIIYTCTGCQVSKLPQDMQYLDWREFRAGTLVPLQQAAQHALELLHGLPGQGDGITFQAQQAAACILANVQWLDNDLGQA